MTEETTRNIDGVDDPQGGAEGDKKTDYVKHSSYVQAIDEVKSVKGKLKGALAELNEYKVKEQQQKEQKLLDEQKHLEVIEQLKKQNDELIAQNSSHVKDKIDFRKMNAAMGLLQSKGVNLESKYLGLLPLDEIEVTDSGDIDNNSVTKVVENFQKEHPRLTLPTAKLLPNQKPGSSVNKYSYEEWQRLPPKDRKAAYQEGRVKKPNF